MNIRKIEQPWKEPLYNCYACDWSSESCQIETMYEICFDNKENLIYLCNQCLEEFRNEIMNYNL